MSNSLATEIVDMAYKGPVLVRGKKISSNQFLKVSLNNQFFYFSSLPNVHQTSLQEISFELNQFFKANRPINLEAADFNKACFGVVENSPGLSGEMLFVIETLLLGLIKPIAPSDIKINQVYTIDKDLSEYVNAQCLKIKISPKGMNENFKTLVSLHELYPNLKYRLDGNRQFELDELLKLTSLLEQMPLLLKNIDYIEEPLKNFYESIVFNQCSTIPLALDESFEVYFKNNLLPIKPHSPLVIKPSLFGISPIYRWMTKNPDKRVIISSCYEHPTVMTSLNFLAGLKPLEFHGLENQFS